MSDDSDAADDSDDPSDATDDPSTDRDSTTRSTTHSEPMSLTDPSKLDAARLRELLDRALLAAFVFVAIVAAFGFYTQTGVAIETWVAPAYEPVVKAVFNLALLSTAVAGVSRQLRRLNDDATAATAE